MKGKKKLTRKERREHLKKIQLAYELTRVIQRFFPGLMSQLKQLPDQRNQSYITYQKHVLLMTRILSAILYIGSMRKASEEFNTDTAIENLGYLCGEELKEAPYWETINNYLKKLEPEGLQSVIHELIRRLIRSKAFDGARIRGKYWQVIIDGTQLHSSRKELDGGVYRVHNRGKAEEYTEYYWYVLEAKLVLHPKIVVSIMSEFVENVEFAEKQDCELKAAKRLMERLKKEFPRLPICLCADSLYACEGFFEQCERNGWKYLLNFEEGSIPSMVTEYEALRQIENNRWSVVEQNVEKWYEFVENIDYRGHLIQFIEYGSSCKDNSSYLLTNLPLRKKNVAQTVQTGRKRWKIENEGFNNQKNHGYYLEHVFCYQNWAMKNHYFLIQIGHMISQVMEAWDLLWKKAGLNLALKHQRILESWKTDRLVLLRPDLAPPFQIRFS